MKKGITELLTPSVKLKPIDTGIKSSGSFLKDIKACVFDIYGTLLISGSGDVGAAMESGSAESFSKALNNCGILFSDSSAPLLIKEQFFTFIKEKHSAMKKKGFPFPEIDIVEIWSSVINSQTIAAVLPEISGSDPGRLAASYESTVNPVYPMPGMFSLLKELQKSGIKTGIVSNAQFYTPLIIDILSPAGFNKLGFTDSLCIYSYLEKRAKPDTGLFLKLSAELGKFGIIPGETVYIGNDMLNDIMPASVCGFKTALFAGDRRSLRLREQDDACSNIIPDVIVNKLTDLLNYIQEG